MAFYNVGQLNKRVSGILTGIDLTDVNDLYGCYQSAIAEMLQKAAFPECTNRFPLTVYDQVYDYAPDSRIFGTQILDVRPQGVSRASWDYTSKKPTEDFDRMKQVMPDGTMIAFEFRDGIQVMRVSQRKATPALVLDDCSEVTGWAADGTGAQGLVQDQTVYYQPSASLRFNLAAGPTTGYIQKTIQKVDLTFYQGIGVIFIAVQLPAGAAAHISAIGAKIGSDANNFYNVSASAAFLGTFLSNDWMLVGLNLAGVAATLNPVITAMDFLQIYFTYDGTAIPNVRVGNAFIALPYPMEMLFQTPAIFIPSGATSTQKTITADSDSIILSDAGYMIYQFECASAVALQQGGTIAEGVISTIHGKLYGARARNGQVIEMGLYDLYRGDNPSESVREVGNYYDDSGRGRW